MSGTLVLVRHGQSDWNLKNLFTGWRDVDLTEKGHAEAKAAGQTLKAKGLTFDIAFTSALIRAQKTCQHILDAVGQSDLKTVKNLALNERDYGDLSGLNKDDARAKWGEEQVHVWRRSYDVPPPNGESMHQVRTRITGALERLAVHTVDPVLVVGHGGSLRVALAVLLGLPFDRLWAIRIAYATRVSVEMGVDPQHGLWGEIIEITQPPGEVVS